MKTSSILRENQQQNKYRMSFANITADDIVALLNNTGLITRPDEIIAGGLADNQNYHGIKAVVIAHDDNNVEGQYMVSDVYITLDVERGIVADFGAQPHLSTDDIEEAHAAFVDLARAPTE